MLLYISGGIGFALSIAAIVLIVLFHIKDKSKLLPVILYIFGFILFLGSGFMHHIGFSFSGSSDPEGPLNLTGQWKQTNSESEDTYQGIYISKDTIEIYWVSDGGQTSVLYWAGTFTPPEDNPKEYTWESENDTGRTDASLLGSSDETKAFTYKKGKLTYAASALGVTSKIEAEPQDWGYTPAAQTPDTSSTDPADVEGDAEAEPAVALPEPEEPNPEDLSTPDVP
ncbi:MAG: hypothetical protein K2N78_11020, partial [Oscillospiraceae bacterium]|nr:hypothetical protein [Oscillospiraceae bacterium]